MIPPACEAMITILTADLERALDAQNLLTVTELDAANDFKPRYSVHVVCSGNGLYALSLVSNWRKALLAVEAELKRSGLLTHAEIGWLCPDEMIWRRFHPKTDASPLAAKILESVEKRLVNTKLFNTLAWFYQHCQPPPRQ
jgi:hypothetical protein